MSDDLYFWGEGGAYGPYRMQEDGFPNAGEVMRDFRERRGMSAAELATLYSTKLIKRYGKGRAKPVTATWILNMEKQNKVPTEMNRRRVLAHLLGVPPMLFGLMESADTIKVAMGKKPQQTSAVPYVLKNTFIDTTQYQKNLRLLWQLNYIGTAEGHLKDIVGEIRQLEQYEQQMNGSLQRSLGELLNSYYQLASAISRHQGKYTKAWAYANDAVRVTQGLGDQGNEMLAVALFKRAMANLDWGISGDKVRWGVIEPKRDKIQAAIHDFEHALPLARPQLKGIIWLEMSRAKSLVPQSSTDLALALSMVNQAENMVGRGSHEDPYMQILLDGVVDGLNMGRYLIDRAENFVSMGYSDQAIEVLDDLEDIKDGNGLNRSHTSTYAYIDMLYAQASVDKKDFYTATERAIQGLRASIDINSVPIIALIKGIHSELLTSPVKKSTRVKELGDMLTEYYFSQLPSARVSQPIKETSIDER